MMGISIITMCVIMEYLNHFIYYSCMKTLINYSLMSQDTALLRLAEFGQEEISTILLPMWTQSWTAGLSAARSLHASASLTCGSQLWSLKEAAL